MEWPDGKSRCRWANPNNPRYLQYHDQEWGAPIHDDRKLFEMLILENFQVGLSWECVLNKWDVFQRAFDGFDLEKVCAFDNAKIAALQNDPEIITFEYDTPSIEEFRGRMERTMCRYPYLVIEKDNVLQGYAYAGAFVGWAAYSNCVYLCGKDGVGSLKISNDPARSVNYNGEEVTMILKSGRKEVVFKP